MEQEFRFCTAPDGVNLAYATSGEGPPLVRVANWLTHLDLDWKGPRRSAGDFSRTDAQRMRGARTDCKETKKR